jgi:hypothetical protein
MITSRSFFNGSIQIPNAQDKSPNSDLLGNGIKLDMFIEEFERDILTDCLGYSLYTEFEAFLDPEKENGLKDGAPGKWNDLLNGKEYQLNGVPVKWRGLTFKEGENEKSLIAYYVFCEFLSNDIVNYRGTGVQKEKAKNAESVSADPLFVNAYRKFFKMTEYSRSNNGLRSLYDFLRDMNDIDSETYSSWCPKRFENINLFGI